MLGARTKTRDCCHLEVTPGTRPVSHTLDPPPDPTSLPPEVQAGLGAGTCLSLTLSVTA